MERDGAAPLQPPARGGTLDALPAIVSAVVLLAVVVYVWAEFRNMEPATLLMWAATSLLTPGVLNEIGGRGLVVAAGLTMAAVLIAMLLFLRGSAYRAAIQLSFALMLAGAALVALASVPRSADFPNLLRVFTSSMGFARAAFMFDGIALAAWGSVTALLSMAARRAARFGSSSAPTLRMLAALPTLLLACAFVVVALVVVVKSR